MTWTEIVYCLGCAAAKAVDKNSNSHSSSAIPCAAAKAVDKKTQRLNRSRKWCAAAKAVDKCDGRQR